MGAASVTIIKQYESALKAFCEQNSLDFNKAMAAPRCGNDKVLFIQRISGKASDAPAEILITATVDDGNIRFEKGENADKYL